MTPRGGVSVGLACVCALVATPGCFVRVMTADSEQERLDAFQIGAAKPDFDCSTDKVQQTCVRLMDGPFVVTEVLATATAEAALLFAAPDSNTADKTLHPRWHGFVKGSGHRLLVKTGEALYAVRKQGTVDLEAVTVAGFHPY